jgi:N-acetylglucosaminyl-diphospho-decaprenol L-rhamnosyltransferase
VLRERLDAQLGVAAELGASVVAVDNASSDGSVAFLLERERAAQHLTVVQHGRNRGYAAAANVGAARAPGRDLFLFNPDVGLHSADDVRRLTAVLDGRPHCGVAAPRLVSADGRVQPSARRFPSVLAMAGHSSGVRAFPVARRAAARYLQLPDGGAPCEVDWAIGAAMLIRREAWEAVGGFDERFFLYLEDVDFCLRCGRDGWQTVYVPEVSLRHDYARSSDPSQGWVAWSRARRHHVASMVRFFAKHPRLAFHG